MSKAFYSGGAQSPSLNYSITMNGVDLLLDKSQAKTGSITIDGKTARMAGGPVAFRWTGVPGHTVRFEYNEATQFNQTGLWAVFRFFVDADQRDPAYTAYNLEWVFRQGRDGGAVRVGGKEVTYRFTVDTGGGAPVFNKEFLASLRCVSNAAR